MAVVRYMTTDEVLAIQRVQIRETGGDPTLPASVRACLDAVVALPRQSAGGADAYPDLLDKAAAYLVFLAQNHCFTDGNKRTAAVVMLAFLARNGYDLDRGRATPGTLARLTIDVITRRLAREKVVKWLQKRVIERP
jgi:death-on-curing protein